MIRFVSVAFLLGLGFQLQPRAGSNPVGPGLSVQLTYDYYDVAGTTAQEIYESLRANGPRTGGQSFFALTLVQTSFAYTLNQKAGSCRLADVEVTSQVVMHFPQWTDRDVAATELRTAWDEFIDRLATHEGGHYRIIERASEATFIALGRLQAATCSMLDSQAKAAVEEIAERQTEENNRYDDETLHGVRDGAVWPPVTASLRP